MTRSSGPCSKTKAARPVTDGTPTHQHGPEDAPSYPPQTRATTAWAQLLRAMTTTVPRTLNEAQDARVRMLRRKR